MITPPNTVKRLLLLRQKRRQRLRRTISCNQHHLIKCKRTTRIHLKKDVGDTGIPQRLDPKATYWYKYYVQFPNLECKAFNTSFRLRFRLPYQSYLSLLRVVNSSDYFSRWNDESDTPNRGCRSPTSLLLLGSLRYLGRGWTFDDLAEVTGISEPLHCDFSQVFPIWKGGNISQIC